jgi:LDH2 family malate/lactate/ureidoglycolate dehydrogenase
MALGFYVRQVRSEPELSAWHTWSSFNLTRVPRRGPWGSQLAQRGLIGVALAQSPEYVAPHGAAQALYGTNPIGTRCLQVPLRCGAAI